MPVNTQIQDNPTVMQYGTLARIDSDTRYPTISVFRTRWPDTSQAYANSAIPISAYDVQLFPRYVNLVYDISNAGLTKGATQTSGVYPPFTPSQIQIYNPSTATFVNFTLTSGLSCNVYVNATSTNTINLAVSSVNNYNGCTVTFLG